MCKRSMMSAPFFPEWQQSSRYPSLAKPRFVDRSTVSVDETLETLLLAAKRNSSDRYWRRSGVAAVGGRPSRPHCRTGVRTRATGCAEAAFAPGLETTC